VTIIDPDLRSCRRCAKSCEPRSRSGGSFQRFCCAECRLGFHKERLRCQRKGLYAGRSPSGFVLVRQQDVIEVAWDQRGNLLLRQRHDLGGEHELHICRDYFPRFLETVDALREMIADAIGKDRAR
jgi:hypothetical protein